MFINSAQFYTPLAARASLAVTSETLRAMGDDLLSSTSSPMNGGSEDDRFALQRTNPKFLIVDDEPMLINAALRMLRRFDIPAQDILKADSPSRAIESFDANAASIRAILSDMMMMPNGTGLDLYRHVRPKRPDLAFAFWSGGMPSHIQSELDAVLALDPNVRFLEKPASLATLSAWFQGAWLLAEPV